MCASRYLIKEWKGTAERLPATSVSSRPISFTQKSLLCTPMTLQNLIMVQTDQCAASCSAQHWTLSKLSYVLSVGMFFASHSYDQPKETVLIEVIRKYCWGRRIRLLLGSTALLLKLVSLITPQALSPHAYSFMVTDNVWVCVWDLPSTMDHFHSEWAGWFLLCSIFQGEMAQVTDTLINMIKVLIRNTKTLPQGGNPFHEI